MIPFMHLFSHFFKNLAKCFTGLNLLWHALAILLTAILVTSGFDWHYFIATRGAVLHLLLHPAVRIGGRLPILLPLALYAMGVLKRDPRVTRMADTLGQAVIMGLLVSSSYKAFTGRVHPPRGLARHFVDTSRVFHFGILRGGMFWGWPSSHTTIAFAMAVSLITLYPKKLVLRYAAICYALYIGIGVSITIHWFSDFVAGVIIGTVIGVVVGTSFRECAAARDGVLS